MNKLNRLLALVLTVTVICVMAIPMGASAAALSATVSGVTKLEAKVNATFPNSSIGGYSISGSCAGKDYIFLVARKNTNSGTLTRIVKVKPNASLTSYSVTAVSAAFDDCGHANDMTLSGNYLFIAPSGASDNDSCQIRVVNKNTLAEETFTYQFSADEINKRNANPSKYLPMDSDDNIPFGTGAGSGYITSIAASGSKLYFRAGANIYSVNINASAKQFNGFSGYLGKLNSSSAQGMEIIGGKLCVVSGNNIVRYNLSGIGFYDSRPLTLKSGTTSYEMEAIAYISSPKVVIAIANSKAKPVFKVSNF